MNKWNEKDEFPIVGQWHVRHQIAAAIDTGYMFGKNFSTCQEAVDFCLKQPGQYRILVHYHRHGWLQIVNPLTFYHVSGGSEENAPPSIDDPDALEDKESLRMGGDR